MGHLDCSERVVGQLAADSKVIQKSVFLAKISTLAIQHLQSSQPSRLLGWVLIAFIIDVVSIYTSTYIGENFHMPLF